MDTDDSSMPTGSMVAPFLVPCFVQPNAFHSLTLFEDRRLPTQDEYALYASEDSTLVDVTKMLLAMLPLHLTSFAAKFAFRMVWFDGRLSTFKQKDLEHIALKAVRDGEASSSDHKTLLDLLFTPGTYLLLAIHGLPAPHQAAGAAVAAAVSAPFAHPPPGHAAARPAQGWRANGSLSSAGLHESGAPEGNWARGGFRGGRGGPGRGGFGGRGGFENGHVVERNGFGAGDKSSLANRGEFGNRSQARVPAPNDGGRGDRGPDRGFNGGVGQGRGDNFASRGGAPSRAAERSDGWGERSGGWNERPASGRAESGWGGGRRDGPQSRSPSPPPRRRDYSPEPVKLRGGRRPSPTY